jgi:hypothetical protein
MRRVDFQHVLAALLPGGGVEDVDGCQLVHFETGDYLGFGDQLDVRDRTADAHPGLRCEENAGKVLARTLPCCRDGEEILVVGKQQSSKRSDPAR